MWDVRGCVSGAKGVDLRCFTQTHVTSASSTLWSETSVSVLVLRPVWSCDDVSMLDLTSWAGTLLVYRQSDSLKAEAGGCSTGAVHKRAWHFWHCHTVLNRESPSFTYSDHGAVDTASSVPAPCPQHRARWLGSACSPCP